ncbi:OLC1v1000792C1 [Oldenlandia corymbosa var. corymbosa]|uniref:OLC1v1000792C1 n=1 Tax=Oldenlandia corymbosa var. corymbosa TaxID=529605 RepID=A0AAV1D605_OLDCO|nr:OLC1v1000792C1 [Oldenlandia corymbosa var. corymbosa]
MGKTRKGSCNGSSGITSLPDSIISHILSFLPTKEVVATSILSKRWRFMWRDVPTLIFDVEEHHKRDTFVNFVYRVLFSGKSECLHKFQLEWVSSGPGFQAVNTWIDQAIARNVRRLDLEVSIEYEEEDFKRYVPGNLFTCGTLEFLRLRGSFGVKVSGVVCLPKLEILDLYSVKYGSDECFRRLISGCPVLHSLIIGNGFDENITVFKISSPSLTCLKMDCWSDEFQQVEIDAPALQSLDFQSFGWKELSVRWPTSVNEVKLCNDYDDETDLNIDQSNSIVKLIEAMSSVSFLKLGELIVKDLSRATTQLSATFERLTQLAIGCVCCHRNSLNVLLECSVQLKVLEISKRSCFRKTHMGCWRDPEQVPKWLLHSLQAFSFTGLEGIPDEMAMIMYILKHGAVMKKIELVCSARCQLEVKFKMTQEILMFPRSSICPIKFD